MKRLKLQKFDDQPSKSEKTGFKAAVKSVLIGFLVIFFGFSGIITTGDSRGNLFPMIVIFVGIALIVYGVFKFMKIMWDNIPE